MAGFRKAKAEQAALKMALYGQPGSGKTFTSLLVGEGIAKLIGKRMAFVDTEHGTDFYAKAISERAIHPEEFDFDAIYTRSLSEVIREVKALDTNQYGVVVIDSITHLWEAAQAAYSGNTNRAGQIPFSAWGKIKAPYKDLIAFLLNSPMHVIICGRQGNEWGEGEDGQTKKIGVKMKAEGETAYEPHILIRMEGVRSGQHGEGDVKVRAVPEKDRTGIFSGRIIENPSFETIGRPLLPYLGATQAQIEAAEDAAKKDAEGFANADAGKVAKSAQMLKQWKAKLDLADSPEARQTVGKEITPQVKKQMTKEDVDALRDYFLNGGGAPAIPAHSAAEEGEST